MKVEVVLEGAVRPIIGVNGTRSEVDWEWREDQW